MNEGRFLIVDLEMESKSDLTALKRALGRNVVVLEQGPVEPGCFELRLETSPQYGSADDTICAFCSHLEKLAPRAKQTWNNAHRKVFDIGFETAGLKQPTQFSINNHTLKRVSALGATIGITIYPRQK